MGDGISWGATGADWERIEQASIAAWHRVIPGSLLARAGTSLQRIVAGVDLDFLETNGVCPVSQAALVVDVASRGVMSATGKSYPVSGKEEQAIIRNPNVANHLVAASSPTSLGVLVCHDLIAFGPVRRAATGARRHARHDLHETMNTAGIGLVVHLAHTTARSGTWSAAWRNLRSEAFDPNVVWTTAFRYRTRNKGRPKNRDGSVKPLPNRSWRERHIRRSLPWSCQIRNRRPNSST